MAASPSSAWRFNLILFVLVVGFSVCSWLVWDRRVAWHVAGTIPGFLQPGEDRHGPVTYVFDPATGILTFPDTGESFPLPSELRGRIQIQTLHPSRTSFLYELDEQPGMHCWNLKAGREVPIPDHAKDCWQVSAGGSRILVMDIPHEKPRRFQVLGLDGAVLQERRLPAPDRPVQHHRWSPEGRYLVEITVDYAEGDRIRIYDLASEKSWSFAEHLGDLSDDGVVWLRDAAMRSDRSPSTSLRAVRLETGQELWKSTPPEAVSDMKYLGKGLLAVDLYASNSCAVFHALSGQRLFLLEPKKEEEPPTLAYNLEIREGGRRSWVSGIWGAWSLDTGRMLTVAGETPDIAFFDDGHRALIDVKCGWPGRIVDVETGKELFQFRKPGQVVGPNVRIAGDRVLASGEDRGSGTGPVVLWERRHPEGWKGHLQRAEVFGAIFLGAAILVLWANRNAIR